MHLSDLEDQRSQIVRFLELLEEDMKEAEPDADQLARIKQLRTRLGELDSLIAEQSARANGPSLNGCSD